MPISLLRRATAYDVTPWRPMQASNTAKPPKMHEQPHEHPLARDARGDLIRFGSDVGHRQLRFDLANGCRNHGPQRGERGRGAQHDAHLERRDGAQKPAEGRKRRKRSLNVCVVDHRRRLGPQIAIAACRGDADDLDVGLADQEMLADRGLAGKVLRGKRLRHDDDRRGTRRVPFVDRPAGEDRNAHRLEKPWADGIQVHRRSFPRRSSRPCSTNGR